MRLNFEFFFERLHPERLACLFIDENFRGIEPRNQCVGITQVLRDCLRVSEVYPDLDLSLTLALEADLSDRFIDLVLLLRSLDPEIDQVSDS